MRRYIAQRLVLMLVSIWAVVTVTFVLMHAIPGNPFADPRLRPEILALMMDKYGLNDPLWEQYLRYWGNLLQGDLGVSLKNIGQSVNRMIAEGFPWSAWIGGQALVFALVVGLTLGTIAALNRNRWPDYTAMVIAVLGVSVPSFVIAVFAQWLFAVKLKLVPVLWNGTFVASILPSLALGGTMLATLVRMMRTQMLDVMGQDYINTARAKGLSQGEVIWRHALRNAILPIVTILGPLVAGILTGTVVIEAIFGIPGLGKYYVESVYQRDYPLILGTTVFYFIFLIVANFLVDLSYGIIDPRIRLTNRARG
ncbi:ABC transporter permease [Thermaerobacter subterraneus]|uniref:ABC-type dipeptide/oligopeptide/nickel transport system, permease component n=1 Tax=Thermaerobacter subterraneus DSM 13965 TaxID=867903 RepID=K6QD51_9FIRM|nr:ABC transporter permease [Thermaerobacter subterraneus]EKP94541.1 ABC-type dipeptide/oligopeptide/nickel transport system, permease component [Thermaerobacter subterraneus DSM 13965]